MLSDKNKILINSVLLKDKDNVELDYCVPVDVNAFLVENGFPSGHRGDIDSNGWAYDFWINYIREEDKKVFMFSGSWWYGDQRFGLNPDEEK